MRAPEGMTLVLGERVGNELRCTVKVDPDWLAARVGLFRLLAGVPPVAK